MKNVVTGLVIAIIIALTTIIGLTLSGRSTREVELYNNLDKAVESTVESTLENANYDIHDKDEFVADFNQNLLLTIDSDSDVTVEVLSADEEKGLLSINVILNYKHPNGKDGTIECQKTVILENYTVPSSKTPYTVTYTLDDATVYKTYVLNAITVDESTEYPKLIIPADPVVEGKTFDKWTTESGDSVSETDDVTGDIALYAKWSN